MLPDDLKAILTEIASMAHSDEYNLRIAAHIADRLLKRPEKILPITIQTGLEQIRHFLSLYKNIDERLGFLYDQTGIWYLKYRPGPRYMENPIYPKTWERDPILFQDLRYIANYIESKMAVDPERLQDFPSHMRHQTNLWFEGQLGDANKMTFLDGVLTVLKGFHHLPASARGARQTIWNEYIRLYRKYPKYRDPYKPMFRGLANPLIYRDRPGNFEPIADDEIHGRAINQAFTGREADCIVKKFGTRWDETGTKFETDMLISKVGKSCIKTYDPPRPPRPGDRLWSIGTPRNSASKITDVTHDGRGLRAEDGHIYNYDSLNVVPIESPWYPFEPQRKYPILWWDKSR